MAKTIDLEKSLSKSSNDIATSLSKGRLIVYPAETMYGLGCDYRIKEGILSLHKLKGRGDNKHFLLLASSWEQVAKIAEIPLKHEKTLEQHWPGQLTAILKSKNLPEWIQYNGKVAIRVTSNPLTRKLLEGYGSPLVSTSLNRSGCEPISDVNTVNEYFKDQPGWEDVSHILLDPSISSGKPSTVADFTGDEPIVLREGGVIL